MTLRDDSPTSDAEYELAVRQLHLLLDPDGPLATGDEDTAREHVRTLAQCFDVDTGELGIDDPDVRSAYTDLRLAIDGGDGHGVARALTTLADIYGLRHDGTRYVDDTDTLTGDA